MPCGLWTTVPPTADRRCPASSGWSDRYGQAAEATVWPPVPLTGACGAPSSATRSSPRGRLASQSWLRREQEQLDERSTPDGTMPIIIVAYSANDYIIIYKKLALFTYSQMFQNKSVRIIIMNAVVAVLWSNRHNLTLWCKGVRFAGHTVYTDETSFGQMQ